MCSIYNSKGEVGASGTGDASTAEPLSVYGPRPAVTRISRRAVVLVGVAAAGLGLVVLMMSSGGRGTADRQLSQPIESDIRPAGPVESVRELPTDYTYEPNPEPAGPQAKRSTIHPTTGRLQEAMPPDQSIQLAELRRELTDRKENDAEQANDSPLVFAKIKASLASNIDPPSVSAAPLPSPEGPSASGPTSLQDTGRDEVGGDRRDSRDAFLIQAAQIEPYLHQSLLHPLSRFELKAGSVVPAALLTAINTDLPGDVIAQVSENVYDSVSGDFLLIPQGSRLLGTYHSLVNNGQNRALLVWQRLIYPNGDSITLGGMPGIDESGAAGVADQVDDHLDKLAAATAFSTAIAYGGNLARNRQSTGNGYTNEDVIGDNRRPGSRPRRQPHHRPATRGAADDHDPPGLAVAGPGEQGPHPAALRRCRMTRGVEMQSIALPAFHVTTTRKLSVEVGYELSQDLERYRAFYKQAYGADVNEADLLREMARRFMEADRQFQEHRNASGSKPRPSRRRPTHPSSQPQTA